MEGSYQPTAACAWVTSTIRSAGSDAGRVEDRVGWGLIEHDRLAGRGFGAKRACEFGEPVAEILELELVRKGGRRGSRRARGVGEARARRAGRAAPGTGWRAGVPRRARCRRRGRSRSAPAACGARSSRSGRRTVRSRIGTLPPRRIRSAIEPIRLVRRLERPCAHIAIRSAASSCVWRSSAAATSVTGRSWTWTSTASLGASQRSACSSR